MRGDGIEIADMLLSIVSERTCRNERAEPSCPFAPFSPSPFSILLSAVQTGCTVLGRTVNDGTSTAIRVSICTSLVPFCKHSSQPSESDLLRMF